MTSHIATDRRANLVGSAWMISAMAFFAIEDAFVKTASVTLPVSQLLILFGAGGAALFAGLALVRQEPLFLAEVKSPVMWARAGFEVVGRLFFALAIALTQLSSATVILQAAPLVVVAGAALVFRERVGWRRWLAILIGLAGVVVILQPGATSFSTLSLLAVLGMLGFAGRDLASRAAPASLSATALGFYGFLAIVLAGALFTFWEQAPFVWPHAAVLVSVLGAVLAGGAAYLSLMTAMRTGEVSAVTPFRYTRLVFGIGIGVFWFGESLTTPMILGGGLIVLSGLFILWRGRAVRDPR